mmetsp:Transcript_870/g.1625  ORF Transcript_870/g.1625 Transcript_870/m.1625 type:complete len:85 (-) Transcript_870:400-654(-)
MQCHLKHFTLQHTLANMPYRIVTQFLERLLLHFLQTSSMFLQLYSDESVHELFSSRIQISGIEFNGAALAQNIAGSPHSRILLT